MKETCHTRIYREIYAYSVLSIINVASSSSNDRQSAHQYFMQMNLMNISIEKLNLYLLYLGTGRSCYAPVDTCRRCRSACWIIIPEIITQEKN